MDKSLYDSQLKSLEKFILNSAPDISYSNFIFAILTSAILAFIVKLTYIKISRTLNDREYFSDTFIPLAIVTTLVITVVKFSLALSLGLVGALSIVRFRAAIKEPEELVYLFLVIGIGLANGANQFLVSTICTFLIILIKLFILFFLTSNQKIYCETSFSIRKDFNFRYNVWVFNVAIISSIPLFLSEISICKTFTELSLKL